MDSFSAMQIQTTALNYLMYKVERVNFFFVNSLCEERHLPNQGAALHEAQSTATTHAVKKKTVQRYAIDQYLCLQVTHMISQHTQTLCFLQP